MKEMKNNYCLFILFAILLIGNISIGYAQQIEPQKYIITEVGSADDINPYIKALKNINLDTYRKENNRTIIRFVSGFEIILLSLNEIKNGVNNKLVIEPTHSITHFVLSSSGQIAVKSQPDDFSISKSANPNSNVKKHNNEFYYPMPPSFPKHVSSGNVIADQKTYSEAKHNWIEKNPDVYNKLLINNKEVQTISKTEYDKMSKEKKKLIKKSSNEYIIEK